MSKQNDCFVYGNLCIYVMCLCDAERTMHFSRHIMIEPARTTNPVGAQQEREVGIIPVLRKAVFRWNNSLSLIKISKRPESWISLRAAAFWCENSSAGDETPIFGSLVSNLSTHALADAWTDTGSHKKKICTDKLLFGPGHLKRTQGRQILQSVGGDNKHTTHFYKYRYLVILDEVNKLIYV